MTPASNQRESALRGYYCKLRRRRGSTSAPLVGVEPNPGPHENGKRKVKKENKQKSSKRLTQQDIGRVKMAVDSGLPLKGVAEKIGKSERQEED
jgi:hypothetical protein